MIPSPKTRLLARMALAYLTNRRRQTLICTMGVAMGVAFFIGIAAMMQGFQLYFINKVIDVAPHVMIKAEYRTSPPQPVNWVYPEARIVLHGLKPKDDRRGILGNQQILQTLAKRTDLVAAPILNGQILLRFGGRDESAQMIGIDPEKERQVSNLERDLVSGNLGRLLTNSNGIILGAGLAQQLGVEMNENIRVVSPGGVQMLMQVVGIVRTGITTIDYGEAYALLRKAQTLQGLPNRINLIKIRLKDIHQAAATAAELEQITGYRTEGWEESNENVFSLFRVQDIILYSVVSAIMIVGSFGIFNIISAVIYEKQKDIAILRAMGFSQQDVTRLFILQGLMISGIGCLMGMALGALLTEGIAKIPIHMGDSAFMDIPTLVVARSPWTYLIAVVFSVSVSVVAALIPARRAAHVHPVEIIRGIA